MKIPSHRRTPNATRSTAFTLVEILVVLVIIGIIAAFAGPAMNSILKSSKMTTATDELVRELNLARQIAIRDNAPVEFRIFHVSDPSQPGDEKGYRAYQASRKLYDPENPSNYTVDSVGKVVFLPDATVFAPDATYSSLIANPGMLRGSVKRDPGESETLIGADYVSFLFMTDGSTSLVDIDQRTLWFLTMIRETDDLSEDEPKEFATIQIDPFTGKLRRYEK